MSKFSIVRGISMKQKERVLDEQFKTKIDALQERISIPEFVNFIQNREFSFILIFVE